MDKVKKCCFCKKEIKGYGNNAEPLKRVIVVMSAILS